MKAALFDPYFDTLGGGERYTSSVASVLLKKGFEVDIWHPNDLTSQVKERFDIDLSKAKFVTNSKKSGYHTIFWVSDGSLPTLFANKVLIHFQFPFQGVNGKSLANVIKSRFYSFVVNSQFTKRCVDREYGVTSTVVYPPVDTLSFKPGKKTNTILYVGRFSNLTQMKGHQILIDTFKKLPELKNWELVLAGGTNVGTNAQEMAQLQASIAGCPIKLVLNSSFKDLQALYARSKIFCSASGFGMDENKEPTKVEHFGITVVEAMAAGAVPVITNLGGHKEIVESNKNGFLWNTVDELEKYLLLLVGDDQKLTELSQEAIARSQNFSLKNFEENLLKVL